MKTYIALLRGINVGGHNKVPMAELRALLTKSGFENVKTYIQTGNIICQDEEGDVIDIESKLRNTILDYFGFEVAVLVRTRDQIQAIFDRCPFPEDQKTNSYFAMLSHKPDHALVIEAKEKTYDNEVYDIIEDALYFYCANGYGKAKFSLNYFERKLKVDATARNYKTMVKLLALSSEN
ncbi:MAG: DUF1697 domain-containing protein [Winogradskyella sp.]|uniref:DUF1697 domain-containing protein n=1 Tax=Winogradskyella sp. TaxID=1883156 RepID=UPI0025CEF4EC|nr:DUF1697 domain-containing protein [Winogradskyella sp.]NRB82186.1 DUF1697 domain-containing protein [Winogradskyella sp.]